jgi:asparagine synthase (glutamine-hydrolysing)
MCGIAGLLLFSQNAPLDADFARMAKMMRHRGPDDEGFAFFRQDSPKGIIFGGTDTPSRIYDSDYPYSPREQFSNFPPKKSILGLVHRRLSILDLSAAGHQPMCTEDGRYWIIHNGEVYNFKEIRHELSSKGETFVSETDTEVILKSFRQWGPDCLKRFNGMWAFALWDDHKKELFCARDRIGIKPFYYYLTDKCFLFASDIKTLIASKMYTPEADWEGVYHSLSFSCAPRPMTCFKGVRALEQAHWMTLDSTGTIRTSRYWRMPVGQIDYKKTEQQWVDELEEHFKKAIQRRLVSDVPVGTFMSGGIDSTTVSALAATMHPGIKAFTLGHGSQSAELDEVPQAKATASMYDMEHVIENSDPEEVLDHLGEIVKCYEEPFPSLGPIYIISRLAKKNKITVVLNGLGPDELFSGYGRERWLGLFRKVSFLGGAIRSLPLTGKIGKLARILGSRDIVDYYINVFSPFGEREKKKLFANDLAKKWDTYDFFRGIYKLESCQFSDDIEALTYLDVINYIGNHHVYRGDQFTMHFSLESRFPFLDHELVEFACRMPSSIKVKAGAGKFIMRAVASKYIDPSCLNMKKKGFVMPMDHWMRSQLKTLVMEKIDVLKKRGIFDSAEVDGLMSGFYMTKDSYLKLWLLVTVELWLESFID